MTTQVDQANEFLMAGGVKSAKFESIGAVATGLIMGFELRNQTDIKTGEMLLWRDGNPRQQLVVTIITDQQDDDDDDGQRRIYAKGQMLNMLREAVRKSGASGLEIDGMLWVKYVGDGEKQPGMNPPKQYRVSYKRPQLDLEKVDPSAPTDDDAPPF